jgi:prevent-host-death family protein
MTTIGTLEAKTHFSKLLERAAAGEEITITRHGKPVARLVPPVAFDRARARAAADGLRRLAQTRTLGLDWRELREEGRK